MKQEYLHSNTHREIAKCSWPVMDELSELRSVAKVTL